MQTYENLICGLSERKICEQSGFLWPPVPHNLPPKFSFQDFFKTILCFAKTFGLFPDTRPHLPHLQSQKRKFVGQIKQRLPQNATVWFCILFADAIFIRHFCFMTTGGACNCAMSLCFHCGFHIHPFAFWMYAVFGCMLFPLWMYIHPFAFLDVCWLIA